MRGEEKQREEEDRLKERPQERGGELADDMCSSSGNASVCVISSVA